jgi:hypothetical protein
MKRSLTGLVALAALAICFPAAASAATADGASSVSPWVMQAVPLPAGATNASLPAVSCTSATSCTAVGSRYRRTGPLQHVRGAALAEHWNGSAWTIERTPFPADAGQSIELSGVSCTSAPSCTAVGNYEDNTGNYHALAEHWDGSAWTVQTPVTPPGVAFVDLFGIWCASAANCTATGYYTTGVTSGPGAALVEHWDGSAWTREPTPANPPGSNVSLLAAVSCTSAASCTAVGASFYNSSPRVRTLAERWNGSRWTIQPTARPSRSIGYGLSGVSCTSTASCTAVGGYTRKPDNGRTLAEHWNGSTWTIQPSPTPSSPSDPDGSLNGVFCTSASQCTAVGGTGSAALAERWNGSTWTVQQTAFPSRHKVLAGLSCTSASTCTAVGGSSTAEPDKDRPVAEHE